MTGINENPGIGDIKKDLRPGLYSLFGRDIEYYQMLGIIEFQLRMDDVSDTKKTAFFRGDIYHDIYRCMSRCGHESDTR